MTIVWIDAGHGGKDSGGNANGLFEKDITLDICKRIESGLKVYQNLIVFMTRTTDVYVSLDERTNRANKANADLLLSVHTNGATSAARGFESYIYPNSGAPTSALQNVMHGEMMKMYGTETIDRGKEQKDLHMLRESKMKAILTENLFLTSPADAALLAKAEYRQKIAQGHITGLEKFLGLNKIVQPVPVQPVPVKPPTDGKLWIVQVGAFENKENAENLANDLRKEGYRPFIKYE